MLSMSDRELSASAYQSAFGFGGGGKVDVLSSDGPSWQWIAPSADLSPSQETSRSASSASGGGKVTTKRSFLLEIGFTIDLSRSPLANPTTLKPETRLQRCTSMAVGLAPVCDD